MPRHVHPRACLRGAARSGTAAITTFGVAASEALAGIAGLGPAEIARFGNDILAVVRHRTDGLATAGDGEIA
jgi:hypothetical protein